MRSYIKTGMALFSIAFLFACNKQLDALAPHNVLFEDQEFSTAAGYTKATVANYYTLSSRDYEYNWFNFSEFRGNNVRVIDVTSTVAATYAKDIDAFNFTNSSSKDFGNSYNFWATSYKALLGINTILKHVTETETNAEILQARAENLFLRAVVNFNLVRLYGRPYYQSPSTNLGIPLILAPIESEKDAPTRATVEQSYKQIIEDLTNAASTFTQSKVNSYASKYAAYGLLSRVYLYMSGTFSQPNTGYAQLARDYADSVISNGGYSLLQGAAYKTYYANDNQANSEIVWAVNHDVFGTYVPLILYQATGAYAGVSAYISGQVKPSPDLLSSYTNGDLRAGFYFTDKYLTNNTDTLSTSKYKYNYADVYTSNSAFQYLRLSEIYLNRAEAKVKLGDNAGALADVNAIRTRAGLDAATALGGQSLFDEILLQRRLELAFEGHNSYDYFRNGLSMVRNYSSFDSDPLTIDPTDARVVLRIADPILAENGKIKQNDQ